MVQPSTTGSLLRNIPVRLTVFYPGGIVSTEKNIMQQLGIIHTPFTHLENMPIQPRGGEEVIGTIEIFDQYLEGLADLDGFSHIYLLYHFHKVKQTALTVTPFMDNTPRGVFSTRSPLRPNHIGLSIVRLLCIEGNTLSIQNIDILDNTPLIDIKPYIHAFDGVEKSRSGWMKGSAAEVSDKRSDGRFVGEK